MAHSTLALLRDMGDSDAASSCDSVVSLMGERGGVDDCWSQWRLPPPWLLQGEDPPLEHTDHEGVRLLSLLRDSLMRFLDGGGVWIFALSTSLSLLRD